MIMTPTIGQSRICRLQAEGAVSLTHWRDGLETADKATCTPTTSSKDFYVSGKQASKDASLELPPMPNTPPTQKTVLAMLSRFQGMFGVAGEVGKEVNPWPASQDDVTDALQYVRINPAHRDRQW